MRNVIQVCELIEADGKAPQSCEAGNLLYFTQTVAMKVQHLDDQRKEDYHGNATWNSFKTQAALRTANRTYSDLTEDIRSGDIKQNFVIQAQQPGLRFQQRFHVKDFPV